VRLPVDDERRERCTEYVQKVSYTGPVIVVRLLPLSQAHGCPPCMGGIEYRMACRVEGPYTGFTAAGESTYDSERE
jgi:hypothetical protein